MTDNDSLDRFAELTDVNLREAWPREDKDFTPWLAENLTRLSDAIGIQMESEGIEVTVGNYQADILARDHEGKRVLIENQLERSDHSHLGQILTYLAGLEARTVIWIAREFNEAHLSAVQWLNENAGDELNPFDFFAVQLKVVQIDNSRLAPLFEVLERPSGWDRSIRASTSEPGPLAEVVRGRRSFWTHYSRRHPEDGVKENWGHSNFWVRSDDGGPWISLMLAQGQVGIFFSSSEITEQGRADWVANRASTIQQYLGIDGMEDPSCFEGISYDTSDQGNWDAMADWLHEKLRLYVEVQTSQPDFS